MSARRDWMQLPAVEEYRPRGIRWAPLPSTPPFRWQLYTHQLPKLPLQAHQAAQNTLHTA